MPMAVIVDWYGPYKRYSALQREAGKNWPKGTRTLYMALGRHNTYRYIGLTRSPNQRFIRHEKMEHDGNRSFYLGEIATRGIAGRRRGRKRAPDLSYAEWALIRFLQPRLNERLMDVDPDDCVSVFSRFFDRRDYETPINPLPKFPRLLGYDSWTEDWYW